MPLRFLTQNDRFIFVDHLTHQIVNSASIVAGIAYDVYVVLQNTDTCINRDAVASAWISGLGHESETRTSGIKQPPKIKVPAAVPGSAGQATMSFGFTPSTSGQGCLYVLLEPNGPTIHQEIVVRESAGDNGTFKREEDISVFPSGSGKTGCMQSWQSA